jgi:hypothetical protein
VLPGKLALLNTPKKIITTRAAIPIFLYLSINSTTNNVKISTITAWASPSHGGYFLSFQGMISG